MVPSSAIAAWTGLLERSFFRTSRAGELQPESQVSQGPKVPGSYQVTQEGAKHLKMHKQQPKPRNERHPTATRVYNLGPNSRM